MDEQGRTEVLQIVEDLNIGGMERIIQTLAVGLSKEKYRVRVWCLTKGGPIADELKAAGIEVEILGMAPRCTLAFLWRLRNKIRDCRIDILHAHGYSAATIGRAAGFLAGVPVMVAHVHSTYWYYRFKHLAVEKLLSLVSGKVICCSQAVAQFALSHEKIAARKVMVVYNGAEDMFTPDVAGMRASLGISAADFVIGVPASLVPHKGHSYFLEALGAVTREYPEVKAVLAGAGPLRKELQDLAEKLGIARNVVFAGVLSKMAPFFAAMDLIVLSSTEREGISMGILEGMSAEKAVVGTMVGGIPEAVVDGETGILVPPWDSRALAAAILRLMRDRDTLVKMGRAGRARYENKFTRKRMLTDISGIYDELLGR
jgi:glycosyltransferase involved in cell wall biosynthesis